MLETIKMYAKTNDYNEIEKETLIMSLCTN